MLDRKLFVLFFALSLFAVLVPQLLLTFPAQAACELEGRQYETGETAGPYVCMPDGTWQQQ
jgi:hypothetical protein